MAPKHWTDNATERPIFSTVISAHGPGGNIFEILGKTRALLRQVGIPRDTIDDLSRAVMAAPSYDSAISLIERWFPVERDDAV